MSESDHSHHGHAEDDAALVHLLDLDGSVLAEYWSSALDWVGEFISSSTGGWQRIVDLGAGSGNGALGLAQRHTDAEIVAIDSSADMLQHLRAKASALGLAERISTLHADLDAGWPVIGPVDLTWASMAMHHLQNPDRLLAEVLGGTTSGGLFAIAEFDQPLRFLAGELSAVGVADTSLSGMEERVLAALGRQHAQDLPHLGSNWSARLTSAGFQVLGERTFAIDLRPPYPAGTAEYARLWLRRLAAGPGTSLENGDRAALAALIEGEGHRAGDGLDELANRGGLNIRGVRTVTVGRRP
ncbi:methyltransferase domain-containing protein [Jatrophihabitans telluris]|uniref:Methyltransferase domain-containing protein n=1 Tax=Jatrophihabitans telluris TaxID=2038343 RepID=A0ABY4QTG8_9ACTN|nr:class I SAM-dependent methyltransferase [Jatrophihabitans telluris]UQX86845.1 methyltransferase domain-containing protein [Jatrophihabitans telluris]